MVDITVRGAGIFGLTIAWECLRLGATLRVIDPAGIGAGASGGLLGALAPHVPENWNAKKAFQFQSLIMARDLWPEIEAASALPTGYRVTGRVQPLASAAAVDMAKFRGVAAQELWQGHATWQVTAALDWPAFAPPSPSGHWVLDTLTAAINPRAACTALAAAIRARGGEILREGENRGMIVHATGHAGLAQLNRVFDKPIGSAIKGQAALLRAEFPAGAPQVFAGGVHIIPHANGTVAIGSTTERAFDQPQATDHLIDALIAQARDMLPTLSTAPILEKWAGLRPRVTTRAPLLGRFPGHEHEFIANGGFKIGIGMAPMVARVMARLITTGRSDIPAEFDTQNLLGAA